jgi:hypothetical protein
VPKIKIGVDAPVKTNFGPVRITAWRDTDLKGGLSKFNLEVRMRGWPAYEIWGMSVARLRALGCALIALADQVDGK